MKINFTKKEYRLLVDLLEMADWVLTSHDATEQPDKKPYHDLIQKIYANSKEMACDDILEFVPEVNQYFVTLEYDEESLCRQHIDKFEDNVFWDKLSFYLSERDLLVQEGEEKLLSMDPMERSEKLFELQDWYESEFYEHGLENIKVVNIKHNAQSH